MDQERKDAGLRHDRTCGRRPRRHVPRRGVVSGGLPGCSLCSACRRSSIWPADPSTALGAYFGITAVGLAIKLGMPPLLFFPVLIVAGLAIGLIGWPIERVLRDRLSPRRELSTADHLRLSPDVSGCVSLSVGRNAANHGQCLSRLPARRTSGAFGCRPTICLSSRPAWRSRWRSVFSSIAPGPGRIVRATAENRDMAEGLGVICLEESSRWSSPSAACSAPSAARWWCRRGAASLDMAVDLVVESLPWSSSAGSAACAARWSVR